MACIDPRDIHQVDYWGRPILVNCGVCPNCRADKISLIESRAKEEWRNHEFCAFVRFSYDDNHLPYKNYIRDSAGTLFPVGRPSVRNEDLAFIPRRIRDIFRYDNSCGRPLPKNCSRNFSWLGATEYGEARNRPHLHFIFFGLDWCYIKPLLQKRVWPCGSVDVRPLKNGGIRYLLDYLEQIPNGEMADSLFFDLGIEKPKVSWSKSFGSSFFYNNAKSINEYGCIRIGQRFIPVSTYYKNKIMTFDVDNINRLHVEGNRRRLAKGELARFYGFNGSRADRVKQYEQFENFNRALNFAAKGSSKLDKISMSNLSWIQNLSYFNKSRVDLDDLKLFHIRR